jgi:hypothetical protein
MPRLSAIRRVFALLLGALALGLALPTWQPAAAQDEGENLLHIPLLMRGGVAVTPPPPPPDPNPNPPSRAAIFAEPEKKTGGPTVLVDAQGGVHIAYNYHVPLDETGSPDAIYAYCPPPASQCAQRDRWGAVNLGGPVDGVQLALTPAGKPRLLAVVPNNSKKEFVYGECDDNCLTNDGWSFITVADSYNSGIGDVTGYYLPDRFFALDPQGRPRFVFNNGDHFADPDRYGGYYATCDTSCTTEGSWLVTRFTHEEQSPFRYESIEFPSLTFTRDGRPRVLTRLSPLERSPEDPSTSDAGIYYYECDGGCDNDANWERVKVTDRGYGPYPAWDIEIDAQDRPRAAFFRYDATDGTAKRLFYMACEGGCLNRGAWNVIDIGLPYGAGEGVDIELDAAGNPRLAFLDGGDNLGYAWCDGACTTAASWKNAYADTAQLMEQEYPVARPITCNAGLWDNYSPSLSLDAQGNPRIAFDGGYKARCQYEDPNRPGEVFDKFHEIWHSVRLVIRSKP